MRGQEAGSEDERRDEGGPATPPPSFGLPSDRYGDGPAYPPPSFDGPGSSAAGPGEDAVGDMAGASGEHPAGKPWEVTDEDAGPYDWYADLDDPGDAPGTPPPPTAPGRPVLPHAAPTTPLTTVQPIPPATTPMNMGNPAPPTPPPHNPAPQEPAPPSLQNPGLPVSPGSAPPPHHPAPPQNPAPFVPLGTMPPAAAVPPDTARFPRQTPTPDPASAPTTGMPAPWPQTPSEPAAPTWDPPQTFTAAAAGMPVWTPDTPVMPPWPAATGEPIPGSDPDALSPRSQAAEGPVSPASGPHPSAPPSGPHPSPTTGPQAASPGAPPSGPHSSPITGLQAASSGSHSSPTTGPQTASPGPGGQPSPHDSVGPAATGAGDAQERIPDLPFSAEIWGPKPTLPSPREPITLPPAKDAPAPSESSPPIPTQAPPGISSGAPGSQPPHPDSRPSPHASGPTPAGSPSQAPGNPAQAPAPQTPQASAASAGASGPQPAGATPSAPQSSGPEPAGAQLSDDSPTGSQDLQAAKPQGGQTSPDDAGATVPAELPPGVPAQSRSLPPGAPGRAPILPPLPESTQYQPPEGPGSLFQRPVPVASDQPPGSSPDAPGKGKRVLVAALGVLVLAGVATGGFFAYRSINSSPPADAVASKAPDTSSGTLPTIPPQESDTSLLDSDATDPRALSLAEAFTDKKIEVGGTTYTRVKTNLTPTCTKAASGPFATALKEQKCDRVLRATYVDSKRRYAVTTGIAVLPTKDAAVSADEAKNLGRNLWFRALPAASGTGGERVHIAGGYAAGLVWGRYIVFSYATYADGHTPTTQETGLGKVSGGFRDHTAKVLERRLNID
jgi:hypothetical protein